MSSLWFDQCVYTIRDKRVLDDVFANKGRRATFVENTEWKTGEELLREATRQKRRLAVIFGRASGNDPQSDLIYHAELLNINPRNGRTEYRFIALVPIEPSLPLDQLTLVSQNRPLSRDFIRPYAICYTPKFVLDRPD